MGWATAVLTAAVVTAGLVAGLFAAFSYAVMPGLARAGDAAYVESMQGINVAILNPVFGLCFGGALVLSVLAAVLQRGPARVWVLVGLALYVLVLVVTFAVSVPLDDELEAAGRTDPAAARAAFEDAWVRWNIARTVLSVAAFGSLTWALRLSP